MLAIDRLKKPPPVSRLISTEHPAVQSPLAAPSPVSPMVLKSNNHQGVRNSPTADRVRRSVSGEGLAAHPLASASVPVKGATEIIHLQNSPVVARPEVVAIQVNNRTSTKFADISGATELPAATYESFRGPNVRSSEDVEFQFAAARLDNDRLQFADEATPASRCDSFKQTPFATVTTTAAACVVLPSPSVQPPPPPPPETVAKSPPPGRPRPQIAPKPKMELRQRRASAESSSTDPRTEIAAAVAKMALTKTNSQSGDSFVNDTTSSKTASLEVSAGQCPRSFRTPTAAVAVWRSQRRKQLQRLTKRTYRCRQHDITYCRCSVCAAASVAAELGWSRRRCAE
jgi:hypothetical protein